MADVFRVLTLNLWGVGGNWPARREVVSAGLRELAPDLIAFQEAFKTDDRDSVSEVLGPDYRVVHQSRGLIGDGNCAAIASRWPLGAVEEIDLHLTPRTAGFPVVTMIARVHAPGLLGDVLFANHLPSWEPELEHERELQALAATSRLEELVVDGQHVVLAGDLDAVPDASSIRFLRGLQSIGGTSVRYRDAWESAHPGDPGHTFTPRNPLMRSSDKHDDPARRIDYVFVRCDEHGPTLSVEGCLLAFDRPAAGIWATDHFGVVADLASRATP
jgi:endonuclease/exonuclease/phosphatase family metal-dependent hydrolase